MVSNNWKSIVWLFAFLTLMHSEYVSPDYATWAHDHVVWINGKQQSQSQIIKLVQDYQSRDIRVGGVNIDSAWSTEFNNFEWNLKKFPKPQQLIDWLHSQNIKIMLWVTSVVNKQCSLYEQGVKNGYFLNGGKLIHWWHGSGAFVDYFNPKAVDWWHRQMDKVLDMGVDGFKCDGTDPMTILLRPWPYSSHLKRYISTTEYSHKYYGDFYNYTKSKNPQGLIMSRPTDSYKIYNTSQIFLNYSPKYVMFSGWIGDEDSTFEGLKITVWNLIHSAWNGYLNFGFDIGGYRDKGHNKSVFVRYAQLGAFVPFMENGGGGIHRPWLYGEDIAEIYKKFVDIHYDLKPTFLSYAKLAYANGVSVIEPLATRTSYTIALTYPNTFGYILCQKILVFPVLSENGIVQLQFPSNSDWVYYFNHKKVFRGGTKNLLAFPLNQTPAFLKSNSIISFSNHIKIVGVSPGNYSEVFLYGDYTDQLLLAYDGLTMKIKIARFYKATQSSSQKKKASLHFLGYQIKPTLNPSLIINKQQQAYTVEVTVNEDWQIIQSISLAEQELL